MHRGTWRNCGRLPSNWRGSGNCACSSSLAPTASGRARGLRQATAEVSARRLAVKWGLSGLHRLDGGGRQILFGATRDVADVVLVVMPSALSAARAVAALRYWTSIGLAAKTVAYDAASGSYLTEAPSGVALGTLRGSGAEHAYVLGRSLMTAREHLPYEHRAVDHGFSAKLAARAATLSLAARDSTIAPALASRVSDLANELAQCDPWCTLSHGNLSPASVFALGGTVVLARPDPHFGAPLSFDLAMWAFQTYLHALWAGGEHNGIDGFFELASTAALGAGLPCALVAAWGPVIGATYALSQAATGSSAMPEVLELAFANV